jgi:hypothetical protein
MTNTSSWCVHRRRRDRTFPHWVGRLPFSINGKQEELCTSPRNNTRLRQAKITTDGMESLMAKQQIEHGEQNKRKLKPGNRFISVRFDDRGGVIEFGIFIVGWDRKPDQLLGGGRFEETDLQRVAVELSEWAHDFALCDAEAEGYMRAVDDYEKRK